MKLVVEKGMQPSQKFIEGEGNQEPGQKPGDLIIAMMELEHSVFKRQQKNLNNFKSI